MLFSWLIVPRGSSIFYCGPHCIFPIFGWLSFLQMCQLHIFACTQQNMLLYMSAPKNSTHIANWSTQDSYFSQKYEACRRRMVDCIVNSPLLGLAFMIIRKLICINLPDNKVIFSMTLPNMLFERHAVFLQIVSTLE